MVQQGGCVLRMHVLRQKGADQICLLIAEKSIDGWTGVANRGLVIDDRDDVRRILDERSKAPLILLERSLRAAPRRSLSRLAQLALNRRQQSRRATLHDVVVCSGYHRLHRRLFTDRSGQNDERNVEPFLMQHRQRSRRVELRHRIVGDDEIPFLLVELPAHFFGGLHARGHRLVSSAPELADQ